MPAQVLSSAVNRSLSWLGDYLPVKTAREKFPFVIELTRPWVIRVDSCLDGVLDAGSKLLKRIRSSSGVIMTFIGRIREAIPVNKQIVQSRITGLAEDCRRQLTHLQETALDTFKVASATFESIPCYLDVNVHVAFNPDNRLIGGVIRAKEKLITITTRGLDKTIGENRRKVVIERGAEVCHVLMGYTKGFLPALGGPSTSAEGH